MTHCQQPAGPGVGVGTAHMALPQPSSTIGASGQSEIACDSLQEFGVGKSPRVCHPNGLSRQLPPHGASPHMVKPHRDRPPPFLQKRLVGNSASSPETFSPIQNRNAPHESPTRGPSITHSSGPFVWMRKQRLTLEPGTFPVWAE